MFLTLDGLARCKRATHGFFTRGGGLSEGVYAGLNCGLGSSDDRARVGRNRAAAMQALGLKPESLITLYQVHSATAITVTEPFNGADVPKADGMATCTRGLALGILSADCAPVLFVDPKAEVIGAAHAGWKGAFDGVLEATLQAMIALGAQASHIVAGIGPHISAQSYEVGPEFRERFLVQAPENAVFFAASPRAGHWLFNLAGYAHRRMQAAGVGHIQHIGLDTLAHEELFYSYRRSVLRGEPDYGRGLSAIALLS
jgi:polyphenol oxidase